MRQRGMRTPPLGALPRARLVRAELPIPLRRREVGDRNDRQRESDVPES